MSASESATTNSQTAPVGRPPGKGSIGLSSTGVFLISLAIQLIGYASSFYFARNMGHTTIGKELIGTWQFWLLIASSINGIGDLRIGAAYVFFVSRGRPIREATGTYLVLRIVFVGLAGLSLWLLSPTLGFASGVTELEIIGGFMALPLLWSLSTVYTQLWTAQGRAVKGQIPLLVESCVRTAALVLVALTFLSPNCTGCPGNFFAAVLGAYALGAFASFLVSAPDVLRARGPFQWLEARRMFAYSLPLIGSMLILYFTTNGTPILVGAVLGSALFYVFGAANGFRILGLGIPIAIQAPLFPHLVSLHVRRKFEDLRAATWQVLRYTGMVLAPLILAFVVYRSNLLNIFYDQSFVPEGAVPLAILAVSILPAGLSLIIGTALNAIRYQRLELYVTSVQLAALLATALALMPAKWQVSSPLLGSSTVSIPFALIPLDGLIAAALATLVSSIVAFALNAVFLRNLLAVHIQPLPITNILFSAVAAFEAVAILNRVLPINRYYQLAVGVAIGFAVYGLVLAAVGELAKDDARRLVGALGFPRPIQELAARICWRESGPLVNVTDLSNAKGLNDKADAQAAEDERRR